MSESKGQDELFAEVSRCFVEALRRAMRVAEQDEDGELCSLAQTDLAQRADVARSTLAKYLGAQLEEAAANPNLDIICRLANAIGVPPAMLLMRPQDWASIGTGMLTFLQARADPTFAGMAAELQRLEPTTSPNVAEAALRLARALKIVENEHDPKVSQEIREFRRASKGSVATTAASIPFRLDGVATSHLPALLTICSILGTTTARGNQ